MTMSELRLVEVRLMGDEAQVRETIRRMGWVLEVAWNGGLPPMRRGDGVRLRAGAGARPRRAR
jgi:hypothetical protein